MGQRVTSTDPWPMWPIQVCWPIWPVTHCHLWYGADRPGADRPWGGSTVNQTLTWTWLKLTLHLDCTVPKGAAQITQNRFKIIGVCFPSVHQSHNRNVVLTQIIKLSHSILLFGICRVAQKVKHYTKNHHKIVLKPSLSQDFLVTQILQIKRSTVKT